MNLRLRIARGHTLLELTIALALGLLIVTAALSLYRSQRMAFERADDAARMHDAAAVALDLIGQQAQMAGFASADSIVDASLFACAQGRVTGSDTAASCESLASHSDGLQVRYAADALATWPTNSGAPTDCLGQAVTDAFIMNRFYAKASTSSSEPELYCDGSGGKQAQPVVEGIERMRLMVWLSGASSAVGVSAVARNQWKSAYALEICVVVRGYLNQAKRRSSYIDCDGSSATADDGRTRQAFWRRVAIRNASNVGGAT